MSFFSKTYNNKKYVYKIVENFSEIEFTLNILTLFKYCM